MPHAAQRTGQACAMNVSVSTWLPYQEFFNVPVDMTALPLSLGTMLPQRSGHYRL